VTLSPGSEPPTHVLHEGDADLDLTVVRLLAPDNRETEEYVM
jgi:hypothetical protein